MISVLILTKNEQQDLPGCLEAVRWSDDVHVYDSFSDDRTVDIARAAGAHVIQRPYDQSLGAFGGNEALHRNWAMENIPFKHPWILYLDADERVTAELAESCCRAAENPGGHVAFRFRRRDFLFGTWLRRVQPQPYSMRLFRPDRMRYERIINPVAKPDGTVGHVDGFLDHFPFSKGMAHWFNRHNGYSTQEAKQILMNRASQAEFSIWKAFTERDFHARRFHQKELFYRLPARPLVKFFLLYVVKMGFLDGRAGFTYAALQSIYEYMIVLKTRELENSGWQPELPPLKSASVST